MTETRFHPSQPQLTSFADGDIAPGAARVLSIHLAVCAECRRATGLEGADWTGPAVPIAWTGLDRRAEPDLTMLLGDIATRRWWWAGRGVRVAPLGAASGVGELTYLVSARPGRRIPNHGHRGWETVIVLKGAYSDRGRRYCVGDFSESVDGDWHSPIADDRIGCLCLVACEGMPRLPGLGRVFGPLFKA